MTILYSLNMYAKWLYVICIILTIIIDYAEATPYNGVKTSRVRTSGVKTSGVKTSGVKTSGVKTSGVKTSSQSVRTSSHSYSSYSSSSGNSYQSYSSRNIPGHEGSLPGGCEKLPNVSSLVVLEDCSYSGCFAQCKQGYQFANGDVLLLIICTKGEWHVKATQSETLPDCLPTCLPACQNNGICIAPNECSCPENYVGPQCQYENRPCLNIPPKPKASTVVCNSRSCTIRCLEGYQFPNNSTIANMLCQNGVWVPASPAMTSIPDCQAICSIPCQNGGNCLSYNVCQCPPDFRGPQCQYSIDACSINKLPFNGNRNCTGDGTSLTCKISCPAGIEFEFEPASEYICEYSSGIFEPPSVPQCLYEPNVELMPWESESRSLYTSSNSEDINNLIVSLDKLQELESANYFNGLHNQINLMEIQKPVPGSCFTWGSTHFKTFDGKIFSFDSPCTHTLIEDTVDSTFDIAVKNSEGCYNQGICYRIITIYLGDKQYKLQLSEDKSPLFTTNKRQLPIPSQLPGLRIEMSAHYVLLSLDVVQVNLKWDLRELVQVAVSENMWNRTAGLCGVLDGQLENDILTRSGRIPSNAMILASSWQVTDSEDVCDSKPSDKHGCENGGQELTMEAQNACEKMLYDKRFADCHKLVDVTMFIDACKWDYCACKQQDKSNCACQTVNVYVRECIHKGVTSLRNWRSEELCPMNCSSGRIYKACGPPTQETCGSALSTTEATTLNTEIEHCEEGCYCPEGTLLYNDRCVTKDQCPCFLRGKNFAPKQKIRKGCNTCTCVNGQWECTQVSCGARCAAVGDPHYVTFDGRRYDFMGQCSYYLLKSDNYSIETENVACPGSISQAMNFASNVANEMPSCVKTITIRFGESVIKLKQKREVVVNGQEIINLPYNIVNARVRSVSSIYIVVDLPSGIKVWWDGSSSVYIDIPAELKEKTKGLCGTFNSNQNDDFLTPEGDVEQSIIPFANKWKTSELCTEVPKKELSHPCDINVNRKVSAERYCGKLKEDIFTNCIWHVDPIPFYQDCLYDMCSCELTTSECLCPIFSSYAKECAEQGVNIAWRNDVKECEIKCPVGQVYQICGDSCSRSCLDISSAVEHPCKSQCVEGCNCAPGETLNDHNECIPIGQCPCQRDGIQFKAGYKEIRPGTQYQETCICASGIWDCKQATEDEIATLPKSRTIRSMCNEADHEEFTSCEPAEPVTCKNMHSPPEVSTAVCKAGCQCKRGYVLDSVSKRCILPADCPCHHGGRSYSDNATMQEDCNTCKCSQGKWQCTDRVCAGVCSAWGDSHFRTFDGRLYDFQGSCDYIFVKGYSGNGDSFDVSIQNVPCGSIGVTCSKSVSLSITLSGKEESLTLIRDKKLPQFNKLNQIKVRKAGLFIIAEVPELGVVLQWDEGTRVYVKVNPKWKGRLKGLCGNYNNDALDDFQTPSGGISEASARLFGDSWRLQPYCLDSIEINETCSEYPNRKIWAIQKCGVLKSSMFERCHSEVPVEEFLERCIFDTCACDQGGDCDCLCTALAAYAQECNIRGVPIKWRSQHLCPIQCDERCSVYSPCIGTCPAETCDNTLLINEISQMCGEDACIEGCHVKPCPYGEIYTNSSMLECVPRSKCQKTVCLEENGIVYYEGDLMEQDDCHTCFCSRNQKICKGQPCSTTQIFSTVPTEKPTLGTTQEYKYKTQEECVSGWSSWINNDHPGSEKNVREATKGGVKGSTKGGVKGGYKGKSNVKLTDIEPLPTSIQMGNLPGKVTCSPNQITNITCRTVDTHEDAKSTGLDAECSLERGLYCQAKIGEKPCRDFEISVYCDCGECDVTHPNSPHPQNCHSFYQCVPGRGQVEKSCGSEMMYNSQTQVCDWPDSVILIRPECKERKLEPVKLIEMTTAKFEECDITHPNKPHPVDCHLFYRCVPGLNGAQQTEETCGESMMYNPIKQVCDWPKEVEAIRPECKEQCPEGQIYSDCAINCDQLCLYTEYSLTEEGLCNKDVKCIGGCINSAITKQCQPGMLWRDNNTCVSVKDCTCVSHDGKLVKPGTTFKESECEICQCIENYYVCDTTACKTSQLVTTESTELSLETLRTISGIVYNITTALPPLSSLEMTTSSPTTVKHLEKITTVLAQLITVLPTLQTEITEGTTVQFTTETATRGNIPLKELQPLTTEKISTIGGFTESTFSTPELQTVKTTLNETVTVPPFTETSAQLPQFTTQNIITIAGLTESTLSTPELTTVQTALNETVKVPQFTETSTQLPQFTTPKITTIEGLTESTYSSEFATNIIETTYKELTTAKAHIEQLLNQISTTQAITELSTPEEISTKIQIPERSTSKYPLETSTLREIFTTQSLTSTPEETSTRIPERLTSKYPLETSTLREIFTTQILTSPPEETSTRMPERLTSKYPLETSTLTKIFTIQSFTSTPEEISTRTQMPERLTSKYPIETSTLSETSTTESSLGRFYSELITTISTKFPTEFVTTISTQFPTVELTTKETIQTESSTQSIIIIPTTVSPPPACKENRYKYFLTSQNPLADDAFTASSSRGSEYGPSNARLNTGSGWSPSVYDKDQYLQVKLNNLEPIYGVIVQGSNLYDQYVTSYKIQYSEDGVKFSYVTDEMNIPKIFSGPVDKDIPVKQMFKIPFEAKTIRFLPNTWHDGISMRIEIIGCGEELFTTSKEFTHTAGIITEATTLAPVTISETQKILYTRTSPQTLIYTETPTIPPLCDDPMGLGNGFMSKQQISVSSELDGHEKKFLDVNGNETWQPLMNSPLEWIQFDFLEPRNITGLASKGGSEGWVTAFYVEYSHDDRTWNELTDEYNNKKTFIANADEDSLKVNYFSRPLQCRYLRITPIKWEKNIQMRLEPRGCYLPYLTPPTILEHTVPVLGSAGPSQLKCNYCPGVKEDVTLTQCRCKNDEWWDGENCVIRARCPCFVGHLSYPVGTEYITEDCKQCTCRLNGISDCKTKVCEKCGNNLHSVLTSSCKCTCEPCPELQTLCPTSDICINTTSWCDGIQDCPDDELNCPSSTLAEFTTEPGLETTVAFTAQTKKPCPEVSCPPDYMIVMLPKKSRYEELGTDSSPMFRSGNKKHLKRTKRGYEYRKGGSTKGGAVKTGTAQNVYHQKSLPNAKMISNKTDEECPTFRCIYKFPIPVGVTAKPCPPIECPPYYKIVFELGNVENPTACPRYSCVPPPPMDGVCEITGRTFSTFDGTKYKYDICNHILARDMVNNDWSITLRKNCPPNGLPCTRALVINQNNHIIKLYTDLTVDFDDYHFTIPQVETILYEMLDCTITRLGHMVFLASNYYGYWIIWDKHENVKIGVMGTLNGKVDGLCGFFNHNPHDDKRKSDGTLAQSTAEFVNDWVYSDEPINCEIEVCPIDIQEKALNMCSQVKHKSLSACAKVVNIDRFLSHCVETTCVCLQNNTDDEQCKCEALQDYVMECQTKDSSVDLNGWRIDLECPILCPSPLVHYDCFRYACERSCDNLKDDNPCPLTPICFSGCFCPEGKVRMGDNCVPPLECRDCECHYFDNSHFETFDKSNYSLSGNCSYIVAQDVSKGPNDFQVFITNHQCKDNPTETCIDVITILYKNHIVQIEKNEEIKRLVTIVDKEKVKNYPLNTNWTRIEEIGVKGINVLISGVPLEVTSFYNKFEFSIKLSSYYMNAEKIEGLCGNCNHNPDDDFKSLNGEILDNVGKFVTSWLANEPILGAEENCVNAPKNECISESLKDDPCLELLNTEKFGQCHLLVNPEPFVYACQQELCVTERKIDICVAIETYARKCIQAGLCPEWRTATLCPPNCPSNFEYRHCASGCAETCENFEKLRSDPSSCKLEKSEGCFCPQGKVLRNDSCVEVRQCKPCDTEGHLVGDEWNPDKCTTCVCKDGDGTVPTIQCETRECDAIETVCEKSFKPIPYKGEEDRCCMKYLCVPEIPKCDDIQQPICGPDQVKKLVKLPEGCEQFICECKPKEECDEIKMPVTLEPGVKYVENLTGCCPTLQKLCQPQNCPKPTECPPYYDTVKVVIPDKCCPEYKCEPPKNVCLYELKFSASPKGGEERRSDNDKQIISQKPNSTWTDGPCRECRCLQIAPDQFNAECTAVQCPNLVEHPDYKDYELKELAVPGKCCSDFARVGCKENNQVYKVEETWTRPGDDKCKIIKCLAGPEEKIIRQEIVTTCDEKCAKGWKYDKPNETSEECCGKCVPVACEKDGVLHSLDESWQSEDNCTTFTCLNSDQQLIIVESKQTCPNIDNCPPENVFNDGCCKQCKLTIESFMQCSPIEIDSSKTVGLVKLTNYEHGLCKNIEPISGFTECEGNCTSKTIYNSETSNHELDCKCCQAQEQSEIIVELICEDNSKIQKTISVPSKCSCETCSNEKKTKSYTNIKGRKQPGVKG